MVEDSTSVSRSGPKELVARTPTSEMDESLVKLERRLIRDVFRVSADSASLR